jgi:hypothetical protein
MHCPSYVGVDTVSLDAHSPFLGILNAVMLSPVLVHLPVYHASQVARAFNYARPYDFLLYTSKVSRDLTYDVICTMY